MTIKKIGTLETESCERRYGIGMAAAADGKGEGGIIIKKKIGDDRYGKRADNVSGWTKGKKKDRRSNGPQNHGWKSQQRSDFPDFRRAEDNQHTEQQKSDDKAGGEEAKDRPWDRIFWTLWRRGWRWRSNEMASWVEDRTCYSDSMQLTQANDSFHTGVRSAVEPDQE